MEVVLKVTSRFLHALAMAQPSKAEIQPMTKEPIEVLDDLADQVADEFEAYRQPDEFKDVSLVIEEQRRGASDVDSSRRSRGRGFPC